MPERTPRLRARIESLEKDVARLVNRADRTPERLPIVTERRNPRLAITAYDPVSGTYPTSPADTYWIIFTDSTYDNTDDGQQAITTTERQALAKTTARSLSSEYIERSTLVEVIWDNGRWWISKVSGFTVELYEITLEDTGKQDTIQWDATVGAFYVWGKPVDETAAPIVIDGAADEEKLWITAQYSDPENRVDGLSSFAVGGRVYTATRNGRREIMAPQFHDPRWEIIENNQGATALHGHALHVTDTGLLMNDGLHSDRVPLFDVKQGAEVYSPGATDWWQVARVPIINSPRSVGDQDLGRGTFACDRPVWAAIDPGLSSTLYAIGRPLGPAPGSWVLWPGLPGFVSLGEILTDGDSVERLLVMRDTLSKCWWARADGDWQALGISPFIYAHPCSVGHGSQCYDGTGDYDNIDMRVELPKMGSQEDPNLHDEDFFLYTIQSISDPSNSRGSPFVAVGNYLDGHVGEIRFLTGARTGWALADGTANSVGNGGTGRDLVTNNHYLRFNTVGGGTGGTTQHTHVVVPGAGWLQSGTDRILQNATHLPPYYDLAPYERIH